MKRFGEAGDRGELLAQLKSYDDMRRLESQLDQESADAKDRRVIQRQLADAEISYEISTNR